jgi:GNAT superfamily N-acetyltransferase
MPSSTPAAVSLRDAVPSDAAAAADLFAQLGYDADVDELATRIDALAHDARSRILVAVDGEAVVGVATLYFVPVAHQDGPWCRITALIVDERVRGRGVGQILVVACEEAAAEAGCLRIEATSATRRQDAHRFYERLGYRRKAHHFLKMLAEAM